MRAMHQHHNAQRSPNKLSTVRRRIDRLDERLLRMLNTRAALAQEIGHIKHRKKWPVFDPKREAFVLRHIGKRNHGPLSEPAIRHIFQAILCECRRRERAHPKRRR